MTTLDILPEVTCPPTDLWSDEPPLESDLDHNSSQLSRIIMAREKRLLRFR
jgi:hypothetical protein